MASSKNKKKTKARPKTQARTKPKKTQSKAKTSGKGLALTSAGPSFTVDSVEKSLAWYTDVMGFTIGQRWEQQGQLLGAELKAGSVTFMISQDDWSKGKDRIKGAAFRLYCETNQDIDQLAQGVKSRGGTLTVEPTSEYGARYFTVQDPDGFKITISKEL
jgi:uncharacterized glyoxalase superfamily protein PhnB